VPIEDSIGTLVDLHDEGKIRCIGVSNVSAAEAVPGTKGGGNRVGPEQL
jgi:aryl-alcohol dehydrogenase-like predicted oxidoreductase